MQIEQTALAGVLLLTPRRHGDARGFFAETWSGPAWTAAGAGLPAFREEAALDLLPGKPLSNLNPSPAGQVRGLLLRAALGAVRVSLSGGGADLPGKGPLVLTISAEDGRQIWVPAGIHAGCEALGGPARIIYNATDYLDPDAAGTEGRA